MGLRLGHSCWGSDHGTVDEAPPQGTVDGALLREVVRVGRWNLDPEELLGEAAVERAARTVGLLGSESGQLECPEGLDTQCGTHGEKLSPAIRQRVAIARVLARNTPVVLLDQPFSRQDANYLHELCDNICSLTFSPSMLFEWTEAKRRTSEATILGEESSACMTVEEHCMNAEDSWEAVAGYSSALANRDTRRTWNPEKDGNRLPATVLAVVRDVVHLEKFDEIAYMERGRLLEFGPPSRLLNSNGALARYLQKYNAISFNLDGTASISTKGLRHACWPLWDLEKDMLQIVGDHFVTHRVKADEDLFTEGDSCSHFYIVAKGNCQQTYYATLQGEWPAEDRAYAHSVMGAGDALCEAALVSGLSSELDDGDDYDDCLPASAAALTDIIALALPVEEFEKLLATHTQMNVRVTAMVREVDFMRMPLILWRSAWLLAAVCESDVKLLGRHLQVLIVEAGKIMCSKGDPLDSFLMVVKGQVLIHVPENATQKVGGASKTRLLGPEDCIGLSCFTEGQKQHTQQVMSASAVEDSVLLVADASLISAWKYWTERDSDDSCSDACISRMARWMDPACVAEALQECIYFRNLSKETLGQLSYMWHPRAYDSVYLPRVHSGGFLVAYGEVKLTLQDNEGQFSVRTVGEGEFFCLDVLFGCRSHAQVLRVEIEERAVLLHCSSKRLQAAVTGAEFVGLLALVKQVSDMTAPESLSQTLDSQHLTSRDLAALCAAAYPRAKVTGTEDTLSVEDAGSPIGWLIIRGTVHSFEGEGQEEDVAGETGCAMIPAQAQAWMVPEAVYEQDELFRPKLDVAQTPEGTPWPRQGRSVFFHGSALQVTSQWCIVCPLLFDHISQKARENGVKLEQEFSYYDERRVLKLEELRGLMNQTWVMSQELGFHQKVDVRGRWLRALMFIRLVRRMGDLKNFLEQPLLSEGIWQDSLEALINKADFKEIELQKLQSIRHDRMVHLEQIRHRWTSVGLPLDAKNGPLGDDDLSWQRIQQLETVIHDRQANAREMCAVLGRELVSIVEHVELSGRPGFGKDEMMTIAAGGDLVALGILEERMARAREYMQPEADRVAHELSEIIREMDIPSIYKQSEVDDLRAGEWEMDTLLAAERRLRQLTCLRNVNFQPDDRLASQVKQMEVENGDLREQLRQMRAALEQQSQPAQPEVKPTEPPISTPEQKAEPKAEAEPPPSPPVAKKSFLVRGGGVKTKHNQVSFIKS
ncbi:hypothetical protein CYMTET_20511 [Cymbomonas tetramitiformis]|uniref:Cyclic nucleotide-binding domain-containing protein n=1 Tax=Cymbomonas tetramitiformis TaxID=36881 RepID=A0AAE0G3U7_9CHLO|nr:hypothetical protein CYMTET_20511 [Cymbomonas tetramitiformis]